MRNKLYILLLILILSEMRVLAQSPIGEFRDFQILKNKDTLILNRKFGEWWSGILFGINENINFNSFNLPNNYDPDYPSRFLDSLIQFPATIGELSYHAGLKFEWNPGGSFWGGGIDLNIIDHRRTISETPSKGDSLNTRFVSDLAINYITISPYARYNFRFINSDWYFSSGLDFETKYNSTLSYKKVFDYSQTIDHDKIIYETPLSFRFGVNFGLGLETFSADVNQKMRMKINPYLNFHAGTNVFNEFKSSLNQVYVRLGIAIKLAPDIIDVDTLKWDSTIVMPPQNLTSSRSRNIKYHDFVHNQLWPDSLRQIEKTSEIAVATEKEEQAGATLVAKKQPAPEKKITTFTVNNKPIEYKYPNYNASGLTLEMQEQLDQLADFLKQNKKINVKLTGHTDRNGKDENDRQSKSATRVATARSYLIKKGIDAKRVFFESKGNLSPKYNDNKDNRIVIELLK